MDSEALQRGFQALEDELGQIVPQRRTPAERRQRRTQGGRRKTRSDKKPPDYINPATGLPTWSNRGSRCWNRGGYIVCNDPPNGSRGQAGVYQKRGERGDRGDPDMKGRDKTEAIKEVGIEEVILFVMTLQTVVEVKQVFIKREESAEIEVTLI